MVVFIRALSNYWLWILLACVLLAFLFTRQAQMSLRDARYSIFGLEREQARNRATRARKRAITVLVFALLIYGATTYLVPLLPEVEDRESIAQAAIPPTVTPTPTRTPYVPAPLIYTNEETGTPSATATPKATTTPASESGTPAPTVAPTTQPVAQAHCPIPGVQITSPGAGAVLSGLATISGTASIDGFQFYKIEISAGEEPGAWQSIADVHNSPVSGGPLDTWNTAAFPSGPYWIRLVVVDQTGNYPSPCQLKVTVQN